MTPGRGIIELAKAGADSSVWCFDVTDRLCAGPRGEPFLFGGSALAASVEAMERSVGRPVIWANAQYHSFAAPGMTLRLATEIVSNGKRLTQARLVGEVGGRLVISVQATLGSSNTHCDGQWTAAPVVSSWRDCPVVEDHRIYEIGINTLFGFRLARGRYPDGFPLENRHGEGRVLLWMRSAHGHVIDRPMLAVMADYVSVGICDALGDEIGANSLDNTVRFTATPEGEWVLAEIVIDTIANGIAHGGLRLFSEERVLLAAASTSLVLRGERRSCR